MSSLFSQLSSLDISLVSFGGAETQAQCWGSGPDSEPLVTKGQLVDASGGHREQGFSKRALWCFLYHVAVSTLEFTGCPRLAMTGYMAFSTPSYVKGDRRKGFCDLSRLEVSRVGVLNATRLSWGRCFSPDGGTFP